MFHTAILLAEVHLGISDRPSRPPLLENYEKKKKLINRVKVQPFLESYARRHVAHQPLQTAKKKDEKRRKKKKKEREEK
jgi:hypothetical protein